MRNMTSVLSRDGDVALGDDWVAPDATAPSEMRAHCERRVLFSLLASSITRKIVTFNLVALCLLISGISYLNSSRNSLAVQRAMALVSEAELIADVIEAQLSTSVTVNLATGDGVDIYATLDGLDLRNGTEVFIFDPSETLIANTSGTIDVMGASEDIAPSSTGLTDGLNWLWSIISSPFAANSTDEIRSVEKQLKSSVSASLVQGTQLQNAFDADSLSWFGVLTPIKQGTESVGVVAVTRASGELDALVRRENENMLQMFIIVTLVSIGLSLALAATIANPLSDLAAAAEQGRDKNSRKVNPGRFRIPDLTARRDELGRLSGALRGMISALYNRIDSNEQFAADVAHEINNPLASLRSAVGTLRVIKRDDQREKLFDVIEHDVRRLDRLVSDISNISCLDSELVNAEQESFNLLIMLENICEYLGENARSKGINFIADLPPNPLEVHGLEARLAQVFVNLITNALSFCEDGDAIRIWVRKREDRILIVVEDTGPGIPDQALSKIFKRFYSQRPDEHFGNNSGLGLAISKQIVEAHSGVIWAENIRPAEADITYEPLGARFVVGLPV